MTRSIRDATPDLRRLWGPPPGGDFDEFHEQRDRVRKLSHALPKNAAMQVSPSA
jgi:hypothetical protein